MKRIIFVVITAAALCIAGILNAAEKPARIVPYTQTSMFEFLNGIDLAKSNWIASLPAAGDWTTYSFIAGDTLTTLTVSNARRVDFVFSDSSLAGVDTFGIKLKIPSPITSGYLYTSIFVKAWTDTAGVTNTGNTSADSLICTNGVTAGFSYIPLGNSTFTGIFHIYRKNANAYAAKTRSAFRWE